MGHEQNRQNNADKPDGSQDEGKALDQRLQALDLKLQSKKPSDNSRDNAPGSAKNTGFAQGLRLGGEFVSGVIVGAAIGFFVDKFFLTSPFGLIIFLLLGFAAGILNLLRAVGAVSHLEKNGDKKP